MYSVDAITLLASRMDALAQRLEKVSSSPSPGGSSGSAVEVYAICETRGVQGHTSVECYNGPPAIEHVNAFQGYQPPPQHRSHLTAYNQGRKSHSNPHTQPLSYLNKMPCAHQDFNPEQPMPRKHHLHLYLNHPQPTWRT